MHTNACCCYICPALALDYFISQMISFLHADGHPKAISKLDATIIFGSLFLTAETIRTYLSKHDHMRSKSDTGQSDSVPHSA